MDSVFQANWILTDVPILMPNIFDYDPSSSEIFKSSDIFSKICFYNATFPVVSDTIGHLHRTFEVTITFSEAVFRTNACLVLF